MSKLYHYPKSVPSGEKLTSAIADLDGSAGVLSEKNCEAINDHLLDRQFWS